MIRRYIIVAEDSLKGFDEAIEKLEREWGAEEIEPCEDAISREEVRRVLGNEVFELMKIHTTNSEDNPKADAMAHGVNWSLNTLMELPSVTPTKKGKWIHIDNMNNATCSICGIKAHASYNFCPICGADMRGDADED